MNAIETDTQMAYLRISIEKGIFTDCLIKSPTHNKHITFALLKAGIAFTRTNHGGGVYTLKREGKD